MFENIFNSIKSVFRGGTRTYLTITGIAIGVASVVINGFISQIGVKTVNSEMDSLGISGISVTLSDNNDNLKLQNSDLTLLRNLSYVEKAMPILTVVSYSSIGENKAQTIVWGIDSASDSVISVKLIYGNDFNDCEIDEQSNVCLISSEIAYKYFQKENAVGESINISVGGKTKSFKIIGIVKAESGLLENVVGEYIPPFVYLPYTTMQSILNSDTLTQIAIEVNDEKTLDEAAVSITEYMNTIKGKNVIKTNNLAKQRDKLSGLMGIVSLVLSAVAGVSLIVSGLGISTTMLVNVNERTKEIGIKKSLGATEFKIMFEFFTEALTICIIGGIIGSAIGVMSTYLATKLLNIEFFISKIYILISLGSALIFGAVFGLYPAAKAARLNPAVALRKE